MFFLVSQAVSWSLATLPNKVANSLVRAWNSVAWARALAASAALPLSVKNRLKSTQILVHLAHIQNTIL